MVKLIAFVVALLVLIGSLALVEVTGGRSDEELRYRALLRHAADRLYESLARDPGDGALRDLLGEIEEALR